MASALTPDTLDGLSPLPGRSDAGAPSTPVLPAGTLLSEGRYELGAPLGRGGFGVTYAATDTRLQRPVAIKELLPEGARRAGTEVRLPEAAHPSFAAARTRFLREATTLARFGHPNIVRIFGVFEENGTAYLVLEHLVGRTLGAELRARRGPLTEPEALEVAGHVAAALAAVHRAGVLHRDVSPANLIRTDDGRTVLIDFGLARPFAPDHTTMMTRIVTPGYAPPEQHDGTGRFSARADVYALGATLHRLLSGHTPPPASDRRAGETLVALWRLNPTVSRRTSDAVTAALALDPAERPASVTALIDRLGVDRDGLDLDDPAADEAPLVDLTMAPTAVVAPDAAPPGARPDGPGSDPDRPVAPRAAPRAPEGPTVAAPPSPGRASDGHGPGPAPAPAAVGWDDPAAEEASGRSWRPDEDVRTTAVQSAAPTPDSAAPRPTAVPSATDGRSGPDPADGPTVAASSAAGPSPAHGPPPGHGPSLAKPAAADPVTELAARGSHGPATTPMGAGADPATTPAGSRGAGAPARSWVVPAPAEADAGPDGAAPEGRRRRFGRRSATDRPAPLARPVDRRWITIPLGAGAVVMTSAQPISLTLVLGLVIAPILATVGDVLSRHDRSPAWAPLWWLRNVGAGLIRSLGALVVLAVGVGLWFGADAIDALRTAAPYVLRVTGLATGALVVLSMARGGAGFRTDVALDAATRRLMPQGRPTLAVGIVGVVGLALVVAGLAFQPEPWPLG